MPNKQYQTGVYYERKTIKVLENQGYRCIRSAGSHGLFDVVAFDFEIVKFIQVKAGTISQAELDDITDVNIPPNCVKEVWVWKKHEPEPDILQIIPEE